MWATSWTTKHITWEFMVGRRAFPSVGNLHFCQVWAVLMVSFWSNKRATVIVGWNHTENKGISTGNDIETMLFWRWISGLPKKTLSRVSKDPQGMNVAYVAWICQAIGCGTKKKRPNHHLDHGDCKGIPPKCPNNMEQFRFGKSNLPRMGFHGLKKLTPVTKGPLRAAQEWSRLQSLGDWNFSCPSFWWKIRGLRIERNPCVFQNPKDPWSWDIIYLWIFTYIYHENQPSM